MNVIILAGGYGQRLWPLTQEFPKALLRLAGKPVLFHLLENISHISGVSSIIIATDESKKHFFKNSVNDIEIISNVRPEFSYHKANADGSVKGPLQKVSEILKSREQTFTSDDFLVVGGDNVFGFDLSEFYYFYLKEGTSCNAIQQHVEPADVSQFGVPTLDNADRLTGFVEKPSTTRHRFVSTACYLLLKSDIERVDEYIAKGYRDTLGEFIRSLLLQIEIIGYRFKKDWYDIGTREGILSANGFLMRWKESNTKEPNHLFGRTEITPPVYVEDTAIINDSAIGPNVYIGKESRILQSSIQNSIVYDRCVLQNCNLKNSIIGSDSRMEGSVSEAVFGPNTLSIIETR
ncbi:MAG TPA: NDP-sugar synthase [Blastocatellia bacterium]|nr:NDP-sugar synthase [Blastocatellia bacterium]